MSSKNFLKFSCLSLGVLFTFCFSIVGQDFQNDFNQDYSNSYYEQKVSLFEILSDSPKDIIFLGNSITDMGEWAEIWQSLYVKNRGISSDITAGVIARLDHIIKGKPEKIFIMIGINDIARNIPENIILQNYEHILNEFVAGSPDTQIYVQSILPTNNRFTEYKNHQNKTEIINRVNLQLEALCKRLSISFIDLNSYFSDDDGKLHEAFTNDGLHLNGKGYMQWKKVLEEGGYCCD